jgi:hypothetical protein
MKTNNNKQKQKSDNQKSQICQTKMAVGVEALDISNK